MPDHGDLATGKPDALLHRSDRGSQYTSEQFQRLMADHGVTCSMAARATSGTMELLLITQDRTVGRKTYRTRDQARADVFDYLECF